MNCYIFDVHINSCFLADTRLEDVILFYTHDLVQVGPFKMICSEAIHDVVENLNRNLVTSEGSEAYVENIDENGNIEIEITENNGI